MFKRLGNLIRGFFGLFISGMEKRNPEALLEVEKENLRKQIAKYNQGLVSHAALCERLMSQVKQCEADERDLRAKATAHLKAGNREKAAEYALRHQKAASDLKENRAQLESADSTYKDLVRARDVTIKEARDRIESLKASLTDMKIKQAVADMNEMASGMIGSIGGSGDTLSRLEEMVNEARNEAAGRARVSRDSLDMTEVAMKETEQKALAEQALAEFAASEGIAIEPVASSAPAIEAQAAPKTMGPGQQAAN